MIKNIIEALLYMQGAQGVSPANLKIAADIPILNARNHLRNFAKEWNAEEHGIKVVEFNDVFKFSTITELKDVITKVVHQEKKQKLSNAAIETAGIIAYKQPISKGKVNEIRGVASEAVVNTLLIKGLIKEKGIAETPGRPILYGITNKFYDYFQIKSLKELPSMNEFNDSEGIDDIDLYSSQREN